MKKDQEQQNQNEMIEETDAIDINALHRSIAEESSTEEEASMEMASPEKAPANPYVALIEDPFGIRTNEISQAQDSPDAIDEELEDLEEINEQDWNDPELDKKLENISRAVEEEVERQANSAEAIAATAEEAQELAEQLAREIAEDEALAAELAKQDEMDEQDPEILAALPQSLDVAEVASCMETLLFLADKPLSVEKLRSMINEEFPHSIYQEAATHLRDQYQATHHGIELVEIAGGLQFRTKPGRAALARKLAKIQTQRLSSGAMETLAIVAYRQPVMKEDIDKIRGVDSSYFVRGLLDRKLIKIEGRSELPGRPMLYSTTDEFLQVFGLKDLQAMPSLREIEQMIPTSQTGNPEDEDPRVKTLRKLVGQMNADTSTSLIYDHREDEKILQEIRERVQSIPSSTAYLDEQKALEKAAAEAAKKPKAENLPIQPDLATAFEGSAQEAPADGGQEAGQETGMMPPPALPETSPELTV